MLYVYNSCNDEWVVERERERVSNRRANKSFFLSSSSVFVCFLRRFSSSIEVSSFFLVTCCVVRSEVQCGWVSRIILVHNTHTYSRPPKATLSFGRLPCYTLGARRSNVYTQFRYSMICNANPFLWSIPNWPVRQSCVVSVIVVDVVTELCFASVPPNIRIENPKLCECESSLHDYVCLMVRRW